MPTQRPHKGTLLTATALLVAILAQAMPASAGPVPAGLPVAADALPAGLPDRLDAEAPDIVHAGVEGKFRITGSIQCTSFATIRDHWRTFEGDLVANVEYGLDCHATRLEIPLIGGEVPPRLKTWVNPLVEYCHAADARCSRLYVAPASDTPFHEVIEPEQSPIETVLPQVCEIVGTRVPWLRPVCPVLDAVEHYSYEQRWRGQVMCEEWCDERGLLDVRGDVFAHIFHDEANGWTLAPQLFVEPEHTWLHGGNCKNDPLAEHPKEQLWCHPIAQPASFQDVAPQVMYVCEDLLHRPACV